MHCLHAGCNIICYIHISLSKSIMPITLQRTFERIFYSSIGQRIVYWLDRYPVRRWLPAFVLIYIAAHGFAELAGDVWLREGFVWDRPVILLIHPVQLAHAGSVLSCSSHRLPASGCGYRLGLRCLSSGGWAGYVSCCCC